MNKAVRTILKIDSSARRDDSVTRQLGHQLVEQLQARHPDAVVLERDIAGGLPFIDEEWVGANFTPADKRSLEQRSRLELSDQLIEELMDADVIVIASPMYNFSVPAALKAYIDLISRAGVTFKYTENGPVGLLQDKQAFVVAASGGTPIGSDIDFLSGYLTHILGFIGIDRVELIAASRVMANEQAVTVAESAIDAALLAVAA